MKVVRIVAPFGLSAVLFVLSYLNLQNEVGGGFYSILLLIIGIALSVVRSAAIFSDKWAVFEAGLVSQVVQIRPLPEIR
jgi:ABC-type nickel/cobalt efflux system permease component RcnA